MSVFAGSSYLFGPLLVGVAVAALVLALRWAYGSARTIPPKKASQDFGLLRAVATIDDPDQASALRGMLADSGIRSTISRTDEGRTIVLVFAADIDSAHQVLGPH